MGIGSIIKKDFKLLTRWKGSATIIVIGPLIIVLLLGLAFSQRGSYNINVGVYSQNYTNLTNTYLKKLNIEGYSLTHLDSEKKCVDSLKHGQTDICVVFPPNLSIEPNKVNEITFYADYSEINLVWMVINTLTSKVSEKTIEISESLTQEIIDQLLNTKNSLKAKINVLNALNTNQEQMKESITDIENKLQSLDLTFDISLEDVNQTTLTSSKVASDVSNLIKKADNLASTANSGLDDIKSEVESLNISSSDKQDLINLIDSVKSDISQIKPEIDSLKSISENDTSKLTQLVNTITSKLNSINQRMSVASSTRNSVVNKISDIKNKINESMSEINDLNATITGIISGIDSIKILNATEIISPIKTQIKPITGKKTHFNFVFPDLIILMIMITAILYSSTKIIREKKSSAFFRNHITPMKDTIFDISSWLTSFIVIIIQIIIFIGIAISLFKVGVGNPLPSIITIIFATTFFIFVGMIIGYIFKTEETSMLASIAIAAIFLFFSNLILPIESMPIAISRIAKYNPFVVGSNAMKQSLIFNLPIKEIANNIYLLILYALILFMIIVGLRQLFSKKTMFHRKMHHKNKKEMRIDKLFITYSVLFIVFLVSSFFIISISSVFYVISGISIIFLIFAIFRLFKIKNII